MDNPTTLLTTSTGANIRVMDNRQATSAVLLRLEIDGHAVSVPFLAADLDALRAALNAL